MSSIVTDLIIEVVKITFKKNDNSSSATYYFSQDYYAANEIYSGSPEIYPLLVSSPNVTREVGTNFAIKSSVEIQLYGANDFLYYNYSLNDFLRNYEKNNGEVEIRFYTKSRDGQTTHSSANIEQKLSIVNSTYDNKLGIITLSTQEVFFKDKEVSKKLSIDTFPDLDPRYDGVYGAIVFGQAATPADGIAIDAPFISSEINGASVPVAKLFSGFCFTNHPNSTKRRLLVKNQHREIDKKEWLAVGLEADPQAAAVGNSVSSPSSDPSNYARRLSLVERGIVWSPAADNCKILTAIRDGLILPSYDCCMDIASTQYIYNKENEDFLSRGDEDFTFSFWAKFDSLSGMICQQGWDDTNKKEWALYHDGSNHLSFSISANGSSIAHTATTASISTGTWYYITCVYDTSVNNKIYIYVNTTAVNTTITNFLTKRNGRFSIGRWSANSGLDGKIYQFRYWKRALSSSDISGLYNSGTPILEKDLSDDQNLELTNSFPLNEPYGIRYCEKSTAALGEGAQLGNNPDITYAYSNKSITVDNQHGELSLEVYHAESLDGGNVYAPIGNVLAKATIDLASNNLDTGALLTTGTQNVFFQVDPPLTLADDANYFFKLNFSNDKTSTYYVLCYYGASTQDAATPHMTRVKANTIDIKQGWQKQTNDFDMQLYFLGDGDNAWENLATSGATSYSYQDLEAKSVTLQSGNQHKEINSNLEFKICIDGILDDSSGTYTGTANALIKNPADVILFTLLNDEFGLGLDSSLVDLTAFESVRDSLDTFGLGRVSIVINSRTTAEEFILEICKQFRIIFYKNRQGLLSLYYPENVTSYDYKYSETSTKENCKLLNYREKDYSSIINKCLQYYSPDILNVQNDISLLRLDEREKLVGKLLLDASESTMNDDEREALATTSQAIYGTRELSLDLPYHDSITTAWKTQKYYFDRYYTLNKTCSFTISREDNNLIDLFDTTLLHDINLPVNSYASEDLPLISSNENAIVYYEGIPVKTYSGGTVSGFINKVIKQANEIVLQIETINTFED